MFKSGFHPNRRNGPHLSHEIKFSPTCAEDFTGLLAAAAGE